MTIAMEKNPIRPRFLRARSQLLWIYAAAFIASFTVFFVFWCTTFFRDAILSGLELRNGTEAFIWWQRPPVTMVYKIYVFNYTNVQEFETGSATKLRVQEMGPYVYRETMTRHNVKFHENGTVSYQEKRSFRWESGRSDRETVVVPNVLLLSAVAYSRNINFMMKLGLTTLLATMRPKTFVQLPAGEFLWGYDDDLFRVAKPWISLKQKVPFEKFGILAFKNGSDFDEITMHTGLDDLRDLGLIERINGMENRNIWGDEECDKIYGTDGSMFPPHLIDDLNSTLHVYAKEICRSVPFKYSGRGQAYGIPTLRYKMPDDIFTWTQERNGCFCSKQSALDGESRMCPPTGIFNVSACSVGSPLLLSFPHFYQADESLREHIDGLEPRKERHETYIDLHPRLGLPISGWSRFQMNLEIRKATGVPFSGNLKDGMILPLIWIDAGLDEMPDDMLKTLEDAHYLANAIEAGTKWCSLIAVLLFFGAFVVELKRVARIGSTPILQRNSSGQSKLIE